MRRRCTQILVVNGPKRTKCELSSRNQHATRVLADIRNFIADDSPNDAEDFLLETDAAPPPRYFCHVCSFKTFGDQMDYHKHVETQQHLANQVKMSDDANRLPCDVCKVNISGYESYIVHMKSKKHKNNMTSFWEERIKNGGGESTSVGFSRSSSRSPPQIVPGRDEQHFCDDCQKPVSGDGNWQIHLASERHRKKAAETTNALQEQLTRMTVSEPTFSQLLLQGQRQQQLLVLPGPPPTVPAPFPQSPGSVSSSGGDISRRCQICGVNVCGEANWRQHIGGKPHKKKEQNMRMDSPQSVLPSSSYVPPPAAFSSPPSMRPSSPTPSTVTTNSTMSSDRHCISCDVWVCGEENYQAHLSGRKHKKALEASKENIKTSVSNSNGGSTSNGASRDAPVHVAPRQIYELKENGYRLCKVCNKEVCGPENWEIHQRGKEHSKKSTEFFSSNKSPQGGKQNDYYCRICNVSMTGIESYEAHMNGQKHRARVRVQEEAKKRMSNDYDDAMQELEEQGENNGMCIICNVPIGTNRDNQLSHFRGQKHREYKNLWKTSHAALQVRDGNAMSATPREDHQPRSEASHETVVRRREGDENTYPSGRGFMLIINQEFKGNPRWQRDGSEEDVLRLHETFLAFGYEIETKYDLRRDEMNDALIKTRERLNNDPQAYSNLVVVIMSHGKNREVMALENNRWFSVDELPVIFSNKACPGLRGRPRIFFINACRGEVPNEFIGGHHRSKGVQQDGPPNLPPLALETGGSEGPDICDNIICYSTVLNSPSYRYEPSISVCFKYFSRKLHLLCRHPRNGTFYIKTLCDAIKSFHETKHLEEILKWVKKDFVRRRITLMDNSVVTQVPEELSNSLSKNFYFTKADF